MLSLDRLSITLRYYHRLNITVVLSWPQYHTALLSLSQYHTAVLSSPQYHCCTIISYYHCLTSSLTHWRTLLSSLGALLLLCSHLFIALPIPLSSVCCKRWPSNCSHGRDRCQAGCAECRCPCLISLAAHFSGICSF